MKLGIRAVLYTIRKWKKTMLIFCLLLSITTLVLSGLAIADAQEEQAEEVRGTTGASFTVERNVSTGGWSSGSGGSYSTQEYLTADMMEKIAEVDGIKGYNASIRTILCLSDSNGNWLEQMNPTGHAMVDTAQDITEILKESAHKMNKCVVVVTHSGELAKQADVVFRLKKGELQVLECIQDGAVQPHSRRNNAPPQ